jgi:hypothetical protein
VLRLSPDAAWLDDLLPEAVIEHPSVAAHSAGF